VEDGRGLGRESGDDDDGRVHRNTMTTPRTTVGSRRAPRSRRGAATRPRAHLRDGGVRRRHLRPRDGEFLRRGHGDADGVEVEAGAAATSGTRVLQARARHHVFVAFTSSRSSLQQKSLNSISLSEIHSVVTPVLSNVRPYQVNSVADETTSGFQGSQTVW
jgi:hypothetical protein